MELSSNYQIDILKDTIRRQLRDVEFKSEVAKRKLFISEKRQKIETYSKWMIEQWKAVLWTNETKINQFGLDGKKAEILIPFEQMLSIVMNLLWYRSQFLGHEFLK